MSLLEAAKNMALSVVPEEDEPDFDWTPVIFGTRGDALYIFGFDPRFLDHKDEWRAAMREVVGESDLSELVLLASTWVATERKREGETTEEFKERTLRDGIVPPSDRPDRREMLTLVYVSADGAETCAMANIERDEVHSPTLGEWEEFPSEMMGPTIATLRAGLR